MVRIGRPFLVVGVADTRWSAAPWTDLEVGLRRVSWGEDREATRVHRPVLIAQGTQEAALQINIELVLPKGETPLGLLRRSRRPEGQEGVLGSIRFDRDRESEALAQRGEGREL